MKIKHYRFPIFICLFIALIPLKYTFCLGAKDEGSLDRYSGNLSNHKPLEQLLYVAQKIEEPALRFDILIEIAAALQEIKEPAMAESVLSQACEIAHNTKNSVRKNIFISKLIDGYINLGRNDKALEITKRMDFQDSRNEALYKIIMDYAKKGEHEEALNLSATLEDPFTKVILLHRLMELLTEQKAYSWVLKVRDMIAECPAFAQKLFRSVVSDEHYRESETPVFRLFAPKPDTQVVTAMVNLARESISLKKDEQARQMLERAMAVSKNIKSQYFKDDSLTQIGLAFVETGDLKKAEELASSIRVSICRSQLQVAMAAAYIKTGTYKKAIILARDIDVLYQKNNILVQVIKHLIKEGKEKEASQLMDSLSAKPSGIYVYSAIADYYIKNREYEKIVKICEKINDSSIKFKILVDMAKGIQKTEDSQPAGQRALKEIMDSLN